MKTTRNAVAVGVLTIAILAGLYLAIQFVSDSYGTDGQYRAWAVFPDASGLHERSHVRMAGLKVGYIESIALQTYQKEVLDEETGEKKKKPAMGARVVFVLDKEVVLYENAEALRAADSLLGDQLVVLRPGDATVPKLKDGGQIKNTGDAGLMGNIDQISSDIKEVTNNLKKVFGSEKGGRQMAEMLENLREISESINELLKTNQETVNRTLKNIDGIAADTRPGVRQIINDIREITKEIRVFVETNTDKAGSAVDGVDGTIKDIRKTVATLDKTVENLNDVIEGVNRGEGTVGRLLKDDKLIDDVERTVEDVSDFVGGVTRLKTIVALSSEYNVLSNSVRGGIQLRLQPREDKYYLIEAAYDPRGSTSTVETVVETTNPEDPAQYREVRHITKDSLLFSLMFARRVHFATFRFGIKDNSAGLGVDIHLIHDRIELSSDIYQFGSDVFPRLREQIAIEFLRHLYVIGGVNDVLNDRRDYFFGLMLRFDDQDLKTILPFVPST
jgi:phospholipid/cholesterol/gamma-HCH transport system substrate-binding protein